MEALEAAETGESDAQERWEARMMGQSAELHSSTIILGAISSGVKHYKWKPGSFNDIGTRRRAGIGMAQRRMMWVYAPLTQTEGQRQLKEWTGVAGDNPLCTGKRRKGRSVKAMGASQGGSL
jgi:hypothetical protein